MSPSDLLTQSVRLVVDIFLMPDLQQSRLPGAPDCPLSDVPQYFESDWLSPSEGPLRPVHG